MVTPKFRFPKKSVYCLAENAQQLSTDASMAGTMRPEFRLSNGVHHAGVGITVPGDDVKAEILGKTSQLLSVQTLPCHARSRGTCAHGQCSGRTRHADAPRARRRPNLPIEQEDTPQQKLKKKSKPSNKEAKKAPPIGKQPRCTRGLIRVL